MYTSHVTFHFLHRLCDRLEHALLFDDAKKKINKIHDVHSNTLIHDHDLFPANIPFRLLFVFQISIKQFWVCKTRFLQQEKKEGRNQKAEMDDGFCVTIQRI